MLPTGSMGIGGMHSTQTIPSPSVCFARLHDDASMKNISQKGGHYARAYRYCVNPASSTNATTRTADAKVQVCCPGTAVPVSASMVTSGRDVILWAQRCAGGTAFRIGRQKTCVHHSTCWPSIARRLPTYVPVRLT
jgi:hypothetical protein